MDLCGQHYRVPVWNGSIRSTINPHPLLQKKLTSCCSLPCIIEEAMHKEIYKTSSCTYWQSSCLLHVCYILDIPEFEVCTSAAKYLPYNSGIIYSKGLPAGLNYGSNMDCRWNIRMSNHCVRF